MCYMQVIFMILILKIEPSFASPTVDLSIQDGEEFQNEFQTLSSHQPFSKNIEDHVRLNIWNSLLKKRPQYQKQQQHQQHEQQQQQQKQQQQKPKRQEVIIRPNQNKAFTKQEKRLRLLFHRCLEECKHFWSQCQSTVEDDNIQEGVVCFQASYVCKEECVREHQIRKKKLRQV